MTTLNWNRDPPPGFQGLRTDIPVTFYFRHLPHWRQDGATYFVTFRLEDSLPQCKLNELRMLKEEWERKNPAPQSEQQWEDWVKSSSQRVEKWLDQGLGNCWLKRSEISALVVSALRFFDGSRYELGCFIVMPNHVHAILRPLDPQQHSLERILQSRKRKSSFDINYQLGETGTLWQEESFDRIVRDEEHLHRCIQYIGANSRLAGLPLEMCPRWIRPDWEDLGWRFEDVIAS